MVAVRGGVHIIGQRLMKRRWLGIVFIFAVLVTGYQFVPSKPTDRDLAAVSEWSASTLHRQSCGLNPRLRERCR